MTAMTGASPVEAYDNADNKTTRNVTFTVARAL
jgi:hypothetical protein